MTTKMKNRWLLTQVMLISPTTKPLTLMQPTRYLTQHKLLQLSNPRKRKSKRTTNRWCSARQACWKAQAPKSLKFSPRLWPAASISNSPSTWSDRSTRTNAFGLGRNLNKCTDRRLKVSGRPWSQQSIEIKVCRWERCPLVIEALRKAQTTSPKIQKNTIEGSVFKLALTFRLCQISKKAKRLTVLRLKRQKMSSNRQKLT